MHRLAMIVLLAVCVPNARAAVPGVVRIEDGRLRLGLDTATGTLRELVQLPGGTNQLIGGEQPFALWQVSLHDGEKSLEIGADRAGPPQIQRLAERRPGLRLVWEKVAAGREAIRVEVEVRLGQQETSLGRWEILIGKPQAMRITHVRFPRVPGIKPMENEVLAVPMAMGGMMSGPRRFLEGRDGKEHRLSWDYPHRLSLQCVAYYQPDGPGFYAACDDPEGYAKTFGLWGDREKRVHFEIVHHPEQEAAEVAQYKIPYAVVLGTFCGDWSTAAQRYRESAGARAWAERGRLRRGQVPAWVRETGVWVWNRGRSGGVLPPAAELAKHVKTPVSVFWHWWHDCPYDAGFPEYLPPREGAAPFKAAMEVAHREGLHVLPYMNQRLWGMNTRSWKAEGAEAFAVKGVDGKIHPEVYNIFMNAPCVPMCLGTDFWRAKYAGMAREVIRNLKADGIYMDQACIGTNCYDPRHGHIVGPGRYWYDGFGLLALGIRDRCTGAGPVVLAGEHCGEAWLPYLDLMLSLSVSEERTAGGRRPWEVIPFFSAVYHTSVICYGSYGSLVYPPYDERWPAEKAPPERLTLLDRKFSRQFMLEQARSFVWGLQPMIPNFLPNQFVDRREEIDYLTRAARTRVRALKYLIHGTWLREPAIDVPQREIDIAKIGTYIKLAASTKRCPMALAGAWRAADGDVGIALASIDDQKLSFRLPVDRKAYGLPERCAVYRIDESGRHRVGVSSGADLEIELPPRAVWVLEFCRNEKE